jgi:arylsulfatase A-like enzyme
MSPIFLRIRIPCILLIFAVNSSGISIDIINDSNEKPNIIFILADDMGYGDVTCYNENSQIPTPHMDRLAEEGILFTDAHSPSAVCTPTRYGFLTGRYCWRSNLKRGVLNGYSPPLIEKDRITVAKLLKDQGYATACIGKWHVGVGWQPEEGGPIQANADGRRVDYKKSLTDGPNTHGFDYSYINAGCSTVDPPYVFIENGRCLGIPNVWLHTKCNGLTYGSDPGLMVPDWSIENVDPTLTAKAVQYIYDHQQKKSAFPFFMYLALSSPHAPWKPPSFMIDKSCAGPRGDMVALVDWCVGEILMALDFLEISDNTLIIVTSDNGPRVGDPNTHQSAGNLRGYKSHIWEGGHRVPLIARWPGQIKSGSDSDETICLTDFMATFAAMTDAELPENAGEDSYNILPALLGEDYQKPIREATIHHSVTGVFALRQGDWKLILGTEGSGGWVFPADEREEPGPDTIGQLYHIAQDPGEKVNLWDEKPDKVNELKAILAKYQKQGYSRSQ